MKYLIPLAVAALLTSNQAPAADLNVEVAGLKDAKGQVLVALYDRADTFLKQPMRAAMAAAQAGKVQLVISDLPAGDYAVTVFQDKNSNGALDTNPVGMPIEPYGFSNDAAGHMGPPSFEQARVHVAEPGSQTTINLR